MRRRTRGRRTALGLATAMGALTLYAAGAAISGHLSLIARRPILDGVGPPPPYDYVNPPPAVASTNNEPPGASITVKFGPKGSVAQTLEPSDGQLLLVMRAGLFPSQPGAKDVLVVAKPMDPAKYPPLPNGLQVLGNAYTISAAYEPGSDRVKRLSFPAVGILTYPIAVNLHTTDHTLFLSTDGKSWQAINSTDVPGLTQVQGTVPALGTLAVGARVEQVQNGPASPTPATTGGGIPRSWLLIAGAVLILLLAGAAVAARRRST
jgi:hypothetical protein